MSVRTSLAEELDDLIAYHKALQSPNPRTAVAQYNSENPMEDTPVLSPSLSVERFAQEEGEAPEGPRPWWRFW